MGKSSTWIWKKINKDNKDRNMNRVLLPGMSFKSIPIIIDVNAAHNHGVDISLKGGISWHYLLHDVKIKWN